LGRHVTGRRIGLVRMRRERHGLCEAAGVYRLVSPHGEADWVRNLRAAGEGELQRRRTRERFAAREVAVAGRAAVIAAYRAVAGRTVEPCFRDLPDPADHPVFVVEREELVT